MRSLLPTMRRPGLYEMRYTSHQGHRIGEIPSDYHDNKKKIILETEELQKHLDSERQQSDDRSISDNISKTTEKFEDLERKLEEPRKQWHQEVDKIFDNYQVSVRSLKNKAVKSITEHKYASCSKSQRMLETIKENKAILRSKTVSKVVNYESKLQEYKSNGKAEDIDLNIPSLKVNTNRGK
ncbi:uncharacterized protein LOC134248155 isoform X2 [Saccostrea cucullata]|uniref:uncharacterized protein LOC134248155 isoform X2 n=1 Tax=Saccostrea cuccullata TaxID=36930 RepID=UPI002ED3A2C9